MERIVTREDVALKISEETKLVCLMASILSANGIEAYQAVNEGYRILQIALDAYEKRVETARAEELIRRRGLLTQ